MNQEQTLVLIYGHFDSQELFKSAEKWDNVGWKWDFRQKSKGIIVTLSSQETLEITDERLKVAGISPSKVIKIWNEKDQDLGVRKTPFFKRDKDCTTKLRKLDRDLLEEFNEAENSPEKTEEHESEASNKRVLGPYNRIEPTRPNQKLTISEEQTYVIHQYYLSCDSKPLININNI